MNLQPMIQRVSNRTNFETHLEENIKRHLGHIPQPTFAATEIATRSGQCQGTGLRNRVSCACRLACVGRLPVGIGRPVWLHGLGRSKFRGFWDQRGGEGTRTGIRLVSISRLQVDGREVAGSGPQCRSPDGGRWTFLRAPQFIRRAASTASDAHRSSNY